MTMKKIKGLVALVLSIFVIQIIVDIYENKMLIDIFSGAQTFGEKHIKLNSIKARNLLRYKIGYLFQNYALIDNDTVEKNLKIALKYRKNIDTKKEIQEALSLVGLDGFQKRKVFRLSGGE